jgi:hypothetical protein
MATRNTRLFLAALVVVVMIGAALAVRAFWTTAKSQFTADSCTIGGYQLDPEQASVAATMVGAVTKYRVNLPSRAIVLVLGAALQESKLMNVPPGQGDRDSVGVLQQRPSQGWGGGSAAALTDVGEATKEFLDKLVAVRNWEKLPLAVAVQDVQISADGTLYAQHEPEAKALTDAFLGTTPAGVSCSFAKPTKVATTAKVAAQVSRELGITTPTAVGQTVQVPGARWQTVAWLVANASKLGIDKVAYNGKQWTRSDGWKSVAGVSSTAVVATMYAL